MRPFKYGTRFGGDIFFNGRKIGFCEAQGVKKEPVDPADVKGIDFSNLDDDLQAEEEGSNDDD